MGYLFPYAGQEKGGNRMKHPYYRELERQQRKARKPQPTHHPRTVFIEPEDVPPMPEKYSFAGMADVPPSLRALMVEICKEHNVTPADLRGIDSRKHVVQARRVYCIRAKDETSCSYTKIARSIDKDHTTVIYFVKQGHSGCSMRPVKHTETPPLGIRRKPLATALTELERTFVELNAQGLSTKEIAAKMGKSGEAVRHYAKRVEKKRRLVEELRNDAG